MADIRIKDLATTASSTAADDFLAVDGTTNGTRKLSAATPSFATSVTVPGVVGPTTTDLTLAGGSTGASLVLGQGASGNLVMSANSAERARLTATGNLLIGTTESAHGYRMFASNQTDNAYIAVSNQSGAAGTRSLRMGFASAATTATIQGTRVGVADDINVAIQAGGGNLLIGTTTDSGNGKLQLATHTTSAGGIGFGTDLSLYRGNTGLLILNDASAALDARIGLHNNGTQRGLFEAYNVGTAVYMGAASAGWGTIITSGNQVAALTLASNQAATFAGAVTTTAAATTAGLRVDNQTGAGGTAQYYANYTTGATTISRMLRGNGLAGYSANGLNIDNFGGFQIGLNVLGGSGDSFVIRNAGTTDLLTIASTGAATFAGTVIAPAATTAISSVRLPHGAAPTSPVNGDMWTTTAGLYVRINGVTVGPLS